MKRNKVRWGVLGVASIATRKVIPGMQNGKWSEISAIASRDLRKGEAGCAHTRNPESVWIVRRASCRSGNRSNLQSASESLARPLVDQGRRSRETRSLRKTDQPHRSPKPGQTPRGARTARSENRRGLHGAHAIPNGFAPREIIQSGRIGDLRLAWDISVISIVTRRIICNIPDFGGGALLDVGCYPIFTSRFVFGEEPLRVMGMVEIDLHFKIDRSDLRRSWNSPPARRVFSCSSQLVPYQHMQFLGTKGRIEIEIPFNPSNRSRAGFLPIMAAMFSGRACESIQFQSAISTPSRETPSPGQFAKTAWFQSPWKIRSSTYP